MNYSKSGIPMKNTIALCALLFGLTLASPGRSADACKDCRDQQRVCAKNYSAKTCKTEYDICMKACRPK
jgi:hypothetical protein